MREFTDVALSVTLISQTSLLVDLWFQLIQSRFVITAVLDPVPNLKVQNYGT